VTDDVLVKIARYVHNPPEFSKLAYETAHHCLIDTVGCGLEGLRVSEACRNMMGPIVEGGELKKG
jgi:2-methylcitrate dehydratase